MLYLLTVELGRDDDVLVADIAWYDVLVELNQQVVAIAQYAVCRRWCGELAWCRVVLHHLNLVAIYGDRLLTVHRRGVGAEGVGALRVVDGTVHVEV